MKIAPLVEVKTKFSEYINESHKGTVVVTKNGKVTAVLLGIENDDELERIILFNSKQFQSMLQNSEKRMEKKKIAHDEFWNKMESVE